MWGLVFVGTTSFAILLLCGLEISRYRNAREDRTAFTYPRRRLSRRLGIGMLMIALMLIVQFGPEKQAPLASLAWSGGCLVLAAVMFVLILRDLREASLQALAEHERFKLETEQRLRASLDTIKRDKKGRS